MAKKSTNDPTLQVSATAGKRRTVRTRARVTRKRTEPAPEDSNNGSTQSISQLAGAVGSSVTQQQSLRHEEIARLAYSYWEARGCKGGTPEEDWRRAEQQLLEHRAPAAKG